MIEEKIYNLAEPRLDEMGYELVRVKYFDQTNTLQIMIELKQEGATINLDDCGKASQELSVLLDVEDIISKKYNLEVSSPGVERPLVRRKDFEKYKGKKAKIVLKENMEGVRRCKATITEVGVEDVLITLDDNKTIRVPFNIIDTANLWVSAEEILKNK